MIAHAPVNCPLPQPARPGSSWASAEQLLLRCWILDSKSRGSLRVGTCATTGSQRVPRGAPRIKTKKPCCPLFVSSGKHGPASCCQTSAGVAGKLGISVATLHGDIAASFGHRKDLRAVSGWTSHAAVRPGVSSTTIPVCKVKSHPDSG